MFTGSVEQFQGIQGPANTATSNPLIKAALMVLLEHWPHSLPFEELRMRNYTLLARAPGPNPTPIDRAPPVLGRGLASRVRRGLRGPAHLRD